MGIPVDFAFDRMSNEPIDNSIVLTKAEMLAINDSSMPDVYFAVCKDDKNMYVYDKSATPSAETGKFKLVKGGGGEEGKTYTMDWDESAHELTLTDGTTPQNLELTGLQSELTAGSNISIVEDPYTGTTVISSTGGSGDATFEIDKQNNYAIISNNSQNLTFNFDDADTLGVITADPGTYYGERTLATKDYVDNSKTVIVGSDWGVAKAGFGRIPASSSGGATVDIDISDLNLSPTDEYEVTFVGMDDSVYSLSSKNNSSFRVKRVNPSPSGVMNTVFHYVVVAKGYGSTPSGGTTGQVLTKKSNVDGDVEWADGGSGGTVDTAMSDTSENAVQNKVIKGYVDGKTGVNFAVGQERWYGTYTDENNVTYQTYSKTIFIPALPSAAGITTYPIGTSNIKQIIDIFGTTTDGFKLNAPRQTVSDNITIYQVSKGSQTFSIEVGKDRSNKSAYVTIIYAKNN